MVHKRRVVDPCYDSGCEKEGRWEVIDRWNSSIGRFCLFHADAKIAELRRAEKKQHLDNGS